MLDIMIQAKNSIEAYNTALRIYSSNIGKMNVIGSKRLTISFQEVFERVLRKGTASLSFEGRGGTNPVQLGGGSTIGGIGIDFSQGALTEGRNLDLAVVGQGLFIVSPDEGESYLYTRAGNFYFDSEGYLRTNTGMQVYGYDASGGTATGDIIPIFVDPLTYNKNLITWTDDGILAEFPDDGYGNPDLTAAPTPICQIALTYFPNPGGLEEAEGTSFRETLASGEPIDPTTPGLGSLVGSVSPRKLEQSNVFYLEETINSLEAQRAMSGSLTLIRLASDTISQFINRLS